MLALGLNSENRDALAKKTLKMTNFLNSHDPWDPEIIQKNTHTGLWELKIQKLAQKFDKCSI